MYALGCGIVLAISGGIMQKRRMRLALSLLLSSLSIAVVPTAVSAPPIVGPSGQSSKGVDPELLAKANSGDAGAELLVGLAYLTGDSENPEDYTQAALWFRKSAEQGNVAAQSGLGLLYYAGKGVPKDSARAAVWFRKAADQGDTRSQVAVGVLYRDGDGVVQDSGQALVWFRKAADQGDAEAEFNLGLIYDDGKGVPQDTGKAKEWYRKAAEQGEVRAQFNLGMLLAVHSGTRPSDNNEAYFWLDIAAARMTNSDQEKAAKARDLVASAIGSLQLRKEQKRAERWTAEHPQEH
jgi:TPR repeat protein